MMRKLSSRLTYANVMATLGVFIALGGSAYAVNTVRSTDIVDGEVKSVDIGNNEIGSADVKDNSLNTFDVHSFIGADVVDESLTGFDIGNRSIDWIDIANNAIDGAHILDRSLNDEDIAEATFVGFVGSIGVVPAQSCVTRLVITGMDAQNDHLILTPDVNNAASLLTYTALYHPNDGNVGLRACNSTTVPIDDGTTNFNLLVIDAQ